MPKLALFDLDGTLNGNKARGDYVPENVRINKDWLPWHKAFRLEKLNLPLINTAYRMARAGYKNIVVSNRDQLLASDTQIYLANSGFPACSYILRADDDNRRPSRWKIDTIKNLLQIGNYGTEVLEVHHFDDDKKALQELEEFFGTNRMIMYIPHLVVFE